MIKDSKFKERLKRYLIVLNIASVLILCGLLFYWFLSVRPYQIDQATKNDHYMLFSMNQLPNGEDKIEAEYIDRSIHNLKQELELVEKDILNADNSDDIIDSAENLLQKTNTLLSTTTNSKTKKTHIKKNYTGQPKIAIIVTSLGLSRRSTELALTLPKTCALGFLPYTKSLKPLLQKAQRNGHEIFLYLPLETSKAGDNPGKYALMTSLTNEENAARLNVVLNSHTKYDGVYSSYKETFTDNRQLSEIVFDHLSDKNLIFVMGKNNINIPNEKRQNHDNIISSTVIIDEEPDKEAITQQLEQLVISAQENGFALGYAQAFTLTIDMLKEWIPQLKKNGIKLIAVSELLKESNL